METAIIALIFSLILIIVSLVWVDGIDYMKENHPDYRGEDLFDDDDDDNGKG
jgi:hypothetical protein